jgi:hypothetical protein
MKLPELQNSAKYIGLYVVDFGEHTGVGFTAQEVAELLESEKYRNCKVYKIHRAYPDGKLEIKGVPAQAFQLETGMFFYSQDLETAQVDFKSLVKLGIETVPPCRAKVHLTKYSEEKYVVTIIYPAEYDDEVSSWLLDGQYKTSGAAEGGTGAVQQYYNAKPETLERHQFFSEGTIESRSGQAFLANLKKAVQR